MHAADDYCSNCPAYFGKSFCSDCGKRLTESDPSKVKLKLAELFVGAYVDFDNSLKLAAPYVRDGTYIVYVEDADYCNKERDLNTSGFRGFYYVDKDTLYTSFKKVKIFTRKEFEDEIPVLKYCPEWLKCYRSNIRKTLYDTQGNVTSITYKTCIIDRLYFIFPCKCNKSNQRITKDTLNTLISDNRIYLNNSEYNGYYFVQQNPQIHLYCQQSIQSATFLIRKENIGKVPIKNLNIVNALFNHIEIDFDENPEDKTAQNISHITYQNVAQIAATKDINGPAK